MSESSTAHGGPPRGPAVSLEDLLFDYPGGDIILRSFDLYDFRVLKMYIFHASPVLGERVLAADHAKSGSPIIFTETATASLPVVQLPDSGAVLFSLLTYVFPVQPILPSIVEKTMELLSAAQKYKMDAVLTHIRNHIAQQHPPFIREENSLYIYSLAQKYGLRQELLKAARCTLRLPTLTIEDLGEKLELMPGAYLHELWKYHQRVRANLTSGFKDFLSRLQHHGIFSASCLANPTDSGAPSWLDIYISSIGGCPSLFDLSTFHMKLALHVQVQPPSKSRRGSGGCRACAAIPSKIVLAFWASLSTVYNESVTEVRGSNLIELG